MKKTKQVKQSKSKRNKMIIATFYVLFFMLGISCFGLCNSLNPVEPIIKTEYIEVEIIKEVIVIADIEPEPEPKEITSFEDCQGLDIIRGTHCLLDYVRPHYKYVISNDVSYSTKTILDNGGDCYDYSLLYNRLAEQLGFKSKQIKFWDNQMGHGISLIYNDKGYCIIDLLNINCIPFE